MMRERNSFETELFNLGLRETLETSAPELLFGEKEALAYELPPKALAPFQVRGGLYLPGQKKAELSQSGIILTSNKVGKEEGKLAIRAPAPITINKELSRLEDHRFDRWVAKYNEFTIYFEEVLRAIGRLRDILSVGAPEEPTNMTDLQRASVWRKPGTQTKEDKKTKYRLWRVAPESAQAKFLATASALPGTYRLVDESRQAYWRALSRFERTIKEARRLKKPEFEDVFPSLADLVGTMTGSAKAGAASVFAIGIDWYLEVRKRRKEYDEKLRIFKERAKTLKDIRTDDFEVLEKAAADYWRQFTERDMRLGLLNYLRSESRQKAAHFGEALGNPNAPDSVKAQLRMAPLVSDAWTVLAVMGPKALTSLNSTLKERAFMHWAKRRYQRGPDPYGAEEITKVLLAFDRADSWKE
jgi:hypothetical protein